MVGTTGQIGSHWTDEWPTGGGACRQVGGGTGQVGSQQVEGPLDRWWWGRHWTGAGPTGVCVWGEGQWIGGWPIGVCVCVYWTGGWPTGVFVCVCVCVGGGGAVGCGLWRGPSRKPRGTAATPSRTYGTEGGREIR